LATSYALRELAALVGGSVEGDGSQRIHGVAQLDEAGPEDLSLLNGLRYRSQFVTTRAGAVIVGPKLAAPERPDSPSLLRVENPYLAFGRLIDLFHPAPPLRPGRHPTALVEEGAQVDPTAELRAFTFVGRGASIGPRTLLHPGVVIEADARIGADCLLHANAVVRERCEIGDRVILQPGAVVGSDGFGYVFDPKRPAHVKVAQVGIARLEDDVELGACACVDRATLGATVVGRGTKLDNLVHIAHNVQVGMHSLLCAQVGIAGSTTIGSGVVLAGQAGVVDHVHIDDRVTVGAQSGVTGDVAAGASVSGFPARDHAGMLRAWAALQRLPALRREHEGLMRRVEELERLLAGYQASPAARKSP
jgi:UDP-3-O-[3-hydroxymyristoyl] glucosamine N-acyltransferase